MCGPEGQPTPAAPSFSPPLFSLSLSFLFCLSVRRLTLGRPATAAAATPRPRRRGERRRRHPPQAERRPQERRMRLCRCVGWPLTARETSNGRGLPRKGAAAAGLPRERACLPTPRRAFLSPEKRVGGWGRCDEVLRERVVGTFCRTLMRRSWIVPCAVGSLWHAFLRVVARSFGP